MDLLKQENVQIIDQVSDWKEAIRQSVAPLEKGGYVQSCYKEEIIKNADELGPYFVISEKIAIPHARPEHSWRLHFIKNRLFSVKSGKMSDFLLPWLRRTGTVI